MRPWGLILLPVVLLAVGQTAAKKGALVIAGGGSALNVFILLGYVILLVRGVVWIAVLRRVPLTFAYPFISLSYVVVLVVANRVFGEAVTGRHLAGTALIVAGVGAVWWGERRKKAVADG